MTLGVVAALVFVRALGVAAQGSTAERCTGHATLAEFERASFIAGAFGPDDEVAVALLSQVGCERTMLASVVRLGANIRYADEKVGYVLLTLPRTRLLDALDLPGVAHAYRPHRFHDPEVIRLDPTVAALPPSAPFKIRIPQVARVLPAAGPYFPLVEGGLVALWQRHPTADGRGVRVGVADDGFDLLHPALQQARNAAGEPVPKVADIDLIGVDDTWVQLGAPLQVTKGVLRAAGRLWRVPADGVYRFGVFGRRIFVRGEAPDTIELVAGVLWDEENTRVRVDTDGDADFRNNSALRDYSVAHEVGWFGEQNHSGDHRIPFGVKIEAQRPAVALAIGGLHGAAIVGTLAANRLTGGLYDATAPSVQVVDVRFGFAGVEAKVDMLRAFARPDVDIVHMSGGIGGTEFDRHVFTRAMAVYRKPVAAFTTLPNALRVTEYVSADILRHNVRVKPPHGDAIGVTDGLDWWFPTDGVVNGVLVPSAALSTQSRYVPAVTRWSDGQPHFLAGKAGINPPAPDGYAVDQSLSGTIPYGTGILADLMSEARRQGIRYDNVRLVRAIQISARQIPRYSTAEQHYGLIDALGAWEQLVRMAAADDPDHPTLTSFAVARESGRRIAPVHGFYSDWSTPGTTLEETLWLTRRGGFAGPRRYRLSLRADDGTYTLLDRHLTFTRDRAVRVRFRAQVRPGRHVAFLELRDEQADAVVWEVALHTRAPDVPQPVAPGVERYRAVLQPLAREYRYVRVDAGVQAVRYVMTLPYTGTGRTAPCWFPGFRCSGIEPPPGRLLDAAHHVGPLQRLESLVLNSEPGMAEIFWSNRTVPQYGTEYDGPGPDIPVNASLTVSKYAVRFGVRDGHTLAMTNRLAEVVGKVEMYDARVDSGRYEGRGSHALLERRWSLPAGMRQWRVRVSSPPSGAAAADAFLLSCPSAHVECSVESQRPLQKGGATLAVDFPRAGTWSLVVRSRQRVVRPVAYHIMEARLTPASTEIDAERPHASGSTWSLRLAPSRTGSRYVDFRLARDHGQDRGAGDIRIGLTALDPRTP